MVSNLKKSLYSGLHGDLKDLRLPKLEAVENIFHGKGYSVTYSYDEFTSICPKTGLPDFGELKIEYAPDKYVVEEKSLKLYLVGYRNVGIFKEFASIKILDDFCKAVKPKWAKIHAVFKPRGGIPSIVDAQYKNGKIFETKN
ncbi:MAG: NADPH-dependent 7-cyano-7-deazaguanine reductase QueF [Candidatus Diapherotrites archaeon]|nr:NADPH-dependent 7-cyano-7-deazaguanine reductase QueF [Candidatus Diapherotrites archaeon]